MARWPAHEPGRADGRAHLDRAVRRDRVVPALRDGIRDYYRGNYPLTEQARASRYLNPGRRAREPAVRRAARGGRRDRRHARARTSAPGACAILRRVQPVAAEVDGDTVRRVTVSTALRRASAPRSRADFVLDATELGDLLPLTGTEYVTGFESRSETGEPSAPGSRAARQPAGVQLVLRDGPRPDGDHTIEPTDDYDDWRTRQPAVLGRADDLADRARPAHARGRSPAPSPRPSTTTRCERSPTSVPPRGDRELWTFRRIAARQNFVDGTYDERPRARELADDRLPRRARSSTTPDAAAHLAASKQQSLAMLYWLQTEAPRPDGGAGWPGPAAARRRHRHRRRAGDGAVHPRVAPHPGAVHRRGTGPVDRSCAAPGRPATLRRLGRRRQLPHRPAPLDRRRQLHRRRVVAVPDPARARSSRCGWRTCCRPARTSARPTSPTALPPAPGRVEHRRGVGRARRVLPRHAHPRPARCATIPALLAASSACSNAAGVELHWPDVAGY